MAKKIYVGNLPFSATDDELRSLLGRHGEIKGIEIKTDVKTKSAMAVIVFEGDGSKAAIDALNGSTIGGRKIVASTEREVVINHEEQYG